jgi:hypothetical protein
MAAGIILFILIKIHKIKKVNCPGIKKNGTDNFQLFIQITV